MSSKQRKRIKKLVPKQEFFRAKLNQQIRELTETMKKIEWGMPDCEGMQKWLEQTRLSMEKMKARLRAKDAGIDPKDLP